MTSVLADTPDLSEQFAKPCEMGCGREATHIAKGCMDKDPVHMCLPCLERGIEVVRMAVRMYQRLNKRVMVCADCYRPVLTLATHLEICKVDQPSIPDERDRQRPQGPPAVPLR